MDIFRQLNKEGHTIITVTHSGLVGAAAKRVIIINHGHIEKTKEQEHGAK